MNRILHLAFKKKSNFQYFYMNTEITKTTKKKMLIAYFRYQQNIDNNSQKINKVFSFENSRIENKDLKKKKKKKKSQNFFLADYGYGEFFSPHN